MENSRTPAACSWSAALLYPHRSVAGQGHGNEACTQAPHCASRPLSGWQDPERFGEQWRRLDWVHGYRAHLPFNCFIKNQSQRLRSPLIQAIHQTESMHRRLSIGPALSARSCTRFLESFLHLYLDLRSTARLSAVGIIFSGCVTPESLSRLSTGRRRALSQPLAPCCQISLAPAAWSIKMILPKYASLFPCGLRRR